MRSRLPLLPAAPAALVLGALLLTACSGGADDREASSTVADGGSVVSTASPSTAPGTSAAPPASADAATPDPVAPGAVAAPSAAASAGTTGRPAAPGSAAPASAPPAGGAPAARAADPASFGTEPGRYTYDSRGTFNAGGAPRTVSGTSTLTVERPAGDRQTAVLEGDSGRTETESVLRADGRYLARLLLTTPAFSKEFAADPAVLLLPEGAPVGRSWSFTVRSTDGTTTATAKNRVLRAEQVTVGGRSLPTRVVETVLAIRGDVVYDGTTTLNYAPAERLTVKERGTGRGTVGGIAFTTDTSSALRSVEPS